jgi:hypothetical protein
MPDNRGFYGFFAKKDHKNLQVPQAPRSLWHFGEFLHIHAKIPINGAPLGVCKV